MKRKLRQQLDHALKQEESIKWKLFTYLVAFVCFLIILLWLFQVVFLDEFYRSIKTKGIKSAAATIARNIDSPDLLDICAKVSTEDDLCIRIIDSNGTEICAYDMMRNCLIHRMSDVDLYRYLQKAQKNGGSTLQLFSITDALTSSHDELFSNTDTEIPDDAMQSLVYVKLAKSANGRTVMIMLNAAISPVSSTVDTLRVQLIVVTAILLVAALLLALFISRKISRPIIKINQSAKKIAQGDYDITFEGKGYLEISELNDTLNYAVRELSKVERLRRELIANVSHDLRTPLTMITGYSEVMRDIPDENTPENIQIVIDESVRLTSLVNDLLDISRLQSGKQQLVCKRFCLTQEIKNTLTRYQKLIEQEGYHITFTCDQDAYIYADPIKVTQVVYNLINNAITYTGDDQRIDVVQKIQDGRVRIEIYDTGEGIAEEDLPYIWDRYYKVDKEHKRASIGTGLGLSIVKNVLDIHHASYGVESELGHGSCFWFEFPLDPDPPEESAQ